MVLGVASHHMALCLHTLNERLVAVHLAAHHKNSTGFNFADGRAAILSVNKVPQTVRNHRSAYCGFWLPYPHPDYANWWDGYSSEGIFWSN